LLAGFFTGLFILNPMSYQFKEAIFLQNKEGQKILRGQTYLKAIRI